MPGIGIGAAAARYRRRPDAAVYITASVGPASSALVVGQALNDTVNWPAFADPANYTTSAAGQTIADVVINYIGDTANAVEVLADGDMNNFAVTVTDTGGNVRVFTVTPRLVVHTAPAAAGALADQSFAVGSGARIYDVSGDFSGAGLTFSVSAAAGISIDGATGLVTFDTDAIPVQSGIPVVVTAANSGGSADSAFSLDVLEAIVYSADITGLTTNAAYGLTAQIGVALTGVLSNLQGGETVAHRWQDGSGLIAGASAASYTPVSGQDLDAVQYVPLVDGTPVASAAHVVRYAPPVAVSLTPVVETQGGGTPTVNLAAGFTGSNLTYTENVAWAAVSGSTLTINDELRNDTVTITATNSGGSAQVDLSVTISQAVETDFIMAVETTSASESFTLPMRAGGTYNAVIDWGDGSTSTITASNDPDLTHAYATPGVHTIRMSGTAGGIFFNFGGDKAKVRTVSNLGTLGWVDMQAAFAGCSGMTSFVAGNTDAAPYSCYSAFNSCAALATCSIVGIDFSGTVNLQQMFANCPSLTYVDVTGIDTGSVVRMDEMFELSPAAGAAANPANFDVTSLSATGGMFKFLDDAVAFSQSVYDQVLINYAAQSPLTSGVTLGAGNSPYTTGGAAEAARTYLINVAGWQVKDAGNAVPDTPNAPSLSALTTQITVTLPADPFSNGRPVTSRDIRYSTDEATWAEVTGVTSPHDIIGLTASTLYYVQWQANNFDGASVWSASATATTDAAGTLSVENMGEEMVIVTPGTGGSVSVTISGGVYAGTYAQRVTDSATLTEAMIEAAPTPIVLPTVTGTAEDGDTLTVVPGLWLYDGADPGDQTWVQKLDGVANGKTDLDYLIQTADDGTSFTVDETFGGVTITSAAMPIVFTITEPDQMAAPSLVVDSPSKITVTKASDPADNGSAITSCDLRYSDDEATWTTVTGFTSPYAITGLSPATLYYAQTRAVNGVGAGAWSTSATETTSAGAAAIVDDANAYFWYSPDEITLDGSNNITSWPNHVTGASSTYDLTQRPQGGTVAYDVANSKAMFDGTQTLRQATGVTGPVYTEVHTNGGTVVFFAVVETKAAQGASNGAIVSWAQSAGNNNGMDAIGYQAGTSGDIDLWFFTQNSGIGFAGPEETANTVPAGKMLMETRISPTTVSVYINGVLEHSEAVVNTAYLPSAAINVSLGGRSWSSGSIANPAKVDIYEVFCTKTVGSADDYRAELMARHGL